MKEHTRGSQIERRRSQRVLLAVPIQVEWTTAENEIVSLEGKTQEVNAHGALLQLNARHRPPASVIITHGVTGRSAQAQAVWTDNAAQGGLMRLAVALAVPSETFWGVKIPIPQEED